jgi:hypothetical protein
VRVGTVTLLAVALFSAVACTDAPNQTAPSGILLEPAPGSYLATSHDEVTAILLEEADVSFGVCDEDVGDLKTGDPCIVVSGRITSHDTESWVIALWAVGYDQYGLEVAGTQESFMIPGHTGVVAAYGETVEFVTHLNTADEVKAVRLFAQSFSYAHFQPGPPSTPVSESEMTRITFSRTWLLENDVEPDKGTVTITFPESWLRDPPDIPEGEEIVELAVPTRLLMDHNTSDDPSVITVTFPDRYFDGL